MELESAGGSSCSPWETREREQGAYEKERERDRERKRKRIERETRDAVRTVMSQRIETQR